MKTSKEFFERLQSDEAFAKEIREAAFAKAEAAEKDEEAYKEILISVAAENGYELTGEELEEIYQSRTEALTDEELGKVAGGTSPLCITVGTVVATVVSNSVALSFLITEVKKH